MLGARRRLGAGLLAGGLAVSGPSGAGGPPVDKQTCAAAYEKAQEERQGAQLRAAREQLQICSNASCPLVVRNDCGRWQGEVERDIPTFVLRVKGAPAGLRATLDGSRSVQPDQPTETDPGGHSVRVEAPGYEPVDQSLALRPGERSVPVVIELRERPAPSASAPPPEDPSFARVYAAGAVSLVALGGFAYLGVTGKSREGEFKACKPYCAASDVDEVRTRYLVADVALGVGVIAAGLAAYWLITTPTSPPASASRGLRWSPLLGPRSAGIGLDGRF
jgi:hypothetical protein